MMVNRTRLVVAALLAGVLALAGCGGSSTGDAAGAGDTGGTLTLGVTLEPSSFDPAQAQEGHYIPFYQVAYDTLIRREPDGTLVPMLATEWAYDDDRTVLTLTLRDDVTFTDGEPFNAAAAKANLDHFTSGTGPQAPTLAAVSEVVAVDDTTLELHLTAPDPALLIYLSNAAGFMASPKALEGETIATTPVGSGPYVMDTDSTVQGSQYTFTRNPDYWNPDLVAYDEVVFKYMADETAILNALKTGQLNAANLVDKENVKEAEAAGLTVNTQQSDWVGITYFDRAGDIVPALGDVRVRQAINHTFDRPAMLSALALDMGSVTGQIFGTSSAAFDEAQDSTYEQDVDKARELMAAAGYADGFTVEMPMSPFVDKATITAIEESLGAINISVTWHDSGTEFIPDLLSGEFAMSWMIFFQPNDWQLINQFIAPDATWNVRGYEDPTVSDLIATVQSGSEDEADAAVAELNRYVVEQAWFGPWYRIDQTYMTDGTTNVELQLEQAAPSIYNYTPAG